ncbi:MAG: hypothetical protein GVY16_07205 [Planctomycetes bacterium]|jgi:hypothetical protein|nr:hypothetical protein [Phycisphaerae bacterium]NBB95513.1 hypothetical protein [Planctomycetota bacterium]
MATEAARLARCPGCRNVLEIPGAYHGTRVLCGICEAKFEIPPSNITGSEVLDWIGEPDKDETRADTPAVEVPEELMGDGEAGSAESEEDLATHEEGFRLIRISSRGALFEFPAEKLFDKQFRGAIPRRCLRCGTKAHIQPRIIIFGHEMMDSSAIELEYITARAEHSDHDARSLPIDQMLERLPKVQRISPPGDLPMPYWICDMCSPTNMVFARGDFADDEQGGTCRLQIRRLWRAEEFLVNAGGENTGAHEQLLEALEKNPERPWDTLAGVVQQRLQQWYRPHRGETFVTYVPDATRARTEDGMSGIVVSSRRLICHSSMRHRESDKGEPLELEFGLRGREGTLRVKSPNWEIKKIAVDKVGLERLRRGLAKEGFTTTWH